MPSVEPMTGPQSVRPFIVVLTLTGWWGAPVISTSNRSPTSKALLAGWLVLMRRASGVWAAAGITTVKMANRTRMVI
jgi:hypothetical protein